MYIHMHTQFIIQIILIFADNFEYFHITNEKKNIPVKPEYFLPFKMNVLIKENQSCQVF